jgi:RNA polymerase sigma-70 factor (ECF subfamily)
MVMSVEISDQELLSAFASGDVDAFSQLYDRHASVLLTLLLNILGDLQEAEDELQETFVAFAEQVRTTPVENSRAFLVTVARNRAINRLRGNQRRQNFDRHYELLAQWRDDDSSLALPSDPQERSECLERLNKGLNQLTEAEREVVLLHTHAHLGFREISELLNTPQGTVASRYRTAIGRLREWLNA